LNKKKLTIYWFASDLVPSIESQKLSLSLLKTIGNALRTSDMETLYNTKYQNGMMGTEKISFRNKELRRYM
jgi:hypothetical protein